MTITIANIVSEVAATNDRNRMAKTLNEIQTAARTLAGAYRKAANTQHARCPRVQSGGGRATPRQAFFTVADEERFPMETNTEKTPKKKVSDEEKRANFSRVVGRRINTALHQLDLVSKCTDRSRYSYDQSDIDKIVGVMTKATRDAAAVLGHRSGAGSKFTL